jgi:hypothetical protein
MKTALFIYFSAGLDNDGKLVAGIDQARILKSLWI